MFSCLCLVLQRVDIDADKIVPRLAVWSSEVVKFGVPNEEERDVTQSDSKKGKKSSVCDTHSISSASQTPSLSEEQYL